MHHSCIVGPVARNESSQDMSTESTTSKYEDFPQCLCDQFRHNKARAARGPQPAERALDASCMLGEAKEKMHGCYYRGFGTLAKDTNRFGQR